MNASTQQVAQSNEGPLVTIWTSCYNHEPYLDDYFQGLLAQTYSNIQLILIDDGSQDRSWAKICSYEARLRDKFPLVVLERHENIGAAEEFLTHCWQHTAGEYFCMLESDDYYLPTKIEENVKYLQAHPETGAVHSEVDYVYDDHIEYRHWASIGMKIPEGEIFEALLLGNFIMTCSFCCRTRLIREHCDWRVYLAKGYTTGDYACFLDLARITRFGYLDKSLARYRVLANSASHPTDLSRRYLLVKKHHMVKLDYIDRYGAPARLRHAALEHIHRTNMEYGYLLYLPDQFWEGYRWLEQESPAHCQTLRPRIRSLAMRHKLLWRLIHTAEVRIVFPIAHARKALRRGVGSKKLSGGSGSTIASNTERA